MRRRFLIAAGVVAAMLVVVTGALVGALLAGSTGSSQNESAQAKSTATPVTPTSIPKGYLGLTVTLDRTTGGLRVATIEARGPAANAGLQVGDVLRSVDGQVVRTPEQLRSVVEAKAPGTDVSLTYERGDKESQARVHLGTEPTNASIEPSPGAPRAQGTPQAPNAGANPVMPGRLGAQIAQITPNLKQQYKLTRDSGIVITGVNAGSPAASAGLQPGDLILAVGSTVVNTTVELQRALLNVPVNETVDLQVLRGDQQSTVKVALPAQANLQGLEGVLPPEVLSRLQMALDRGAIAADQLQQLLRQYQVRGNNVRVGKVVSITSDTLVLTPAEGGSDVTLKLTNTTSVQRGRQSIAPTDVPVGDSVLVISMDGGQSAFLIYDIGAI